MPVQSIYLLFFSFLLICKIFFSLFLLFSFLLSVLSLLFGFSGGWFGGLGVVVWACRSRRGGWFGGLGLRCWDRPGVVGLHWVWVFAKAHHQIGLGFGSLRWWVAEKLILWWFLLGLWWLIVDSWWWSRWVLVALDLFVVVVMVAAVGGKDLDYSCWLYRYCWR